MGNCWLMTVKKTSEGATKEIILILDGLVHVILETAGLLSQHTWTAITWNDRLLVTA